MRVTLTGPGFVRLALGTFTVSSVALKSTGKEICVSPKTTLVSLVKFVPTICNVNSFVGEAVVLAGSSLVTVGAGLLAPTSA